MARQTTQTTDNARQAYAGSIERQRDRADIPARHRGLDTGARGWRFAVSAVKQMQAGQPAR